MVANPYSWCHREFVSPKDQTLLLVKFVDLRIDIYFVKLLLGFPDLTMIWLANNPVTDIESFVVPIKLIAQVVKSIQWSVHLHKVGPKPHYASKRKRTLKGLRDDEKGKGKQPDPEHATESNDVLEDVEILHKIEHAFSDVQWAAMHKAHWFSITQQIQ
ncbi:hypothetical protein PAXRUDRAFT_29024 [Paxillus rubicundulus Ve08.2h10]|uniref:Uncharacterized protein n=1 Tax=Paxillus rubicundulus Ve08.2h10 TaxID=930991 RepID=A0A0D0BXF3_9AGAM|nr:hypothetical protein PAXRUDRAFT_29024 [Paxillus rubicundulus Ve08.2h10]